VPALPTMPRQPIACIEIRQGKVILPLECHALRENRFMPTMQPHASGSVAPHIIRHGVPQDIPDIVEIDHLVAGENKPEYWENLFSSGSCEEPRAILVAECDGRVVGFTVGTIRAWEFGSEPCGWIFAIAVRPENREDGIATSLYQALSDFFQRAGVKKTRTMIRRDEHLLMAYFRSLGMMAGPFIQLEKELTDP
jgi:GNAT superfamily N-acetyltransferase